MNHKEVQLIAKQTMSFIRKTIKLLEPHISRPNLSFGYKWENIYYFDNGKLQVL